MKEPKITVLMPVYNSDKYLPEAIESILNQTFSDFEFLIFNDGSTDNSAGIVRSFKDPRIVFFDYKENSGYLVRLNEGIKIAKGKYIARMDSDDISLPQRFEKQVNFMENNLDYGVCGTQAVTIGSVKGYVTRLPIEDEKIRSCLLFDGAIGHPTVMMRKSILEKYNLFYDQNFYTAEDYKMWVDISRYSKLGNIPEVLLMYRFHSDQIANTHSALQRENLKKIHKQQFDKIGLVPTEEERKIHSSIWNNSLNRSFSSIDKAGDWFLKLKHINQQKRIFPEPAFSQVLDEKWFYLCIHQRHLGIWAWKIFIEWPLFNHGVRLSIYGSIELLLENLLMMIKGTKIHK